MTEAEMLLEHELAAYKGCEDEITKKLLLVRIGMYEREVEAERALAREKEQ